MYVSSLAGREVYSTPMRRTLEGHALLRRAADARAPGAHQPHASADSRAMFALGLWAAVLTTNQLLGRRYIDPGSGSFAIQIIIAAVLGGILTARLWLRHMFWRIVGRGRRTKSEDPTSGEETDR